MISEHHNDSSVVAGPTRVLVLAAVPGHTVLAKRRMTRPVMHQTTGIEPRTPKHHVLKLSTDFVLSSDVTVPP